MRMPVYDDVSMAFERINKYSKRTPVLTCRTIDEICDAELFFKCENFQKVGAFKFRGAVNAVFSLDETEAKKGVATHSSGNHAAALALAAKCRGIKAYVVMPENAPPVKKAAVAGYGAEIISCKSTLADREETSNSVVSRTGAVFVHPSNDFNVISGQGTAALELCNEIKELDTIIVPVGGGGLLSGTAIAAKAINSDISVLGIEPVRADDAYKSFYSGELVSPDNPDTIADGLRTALGDLSFPIIRKYVDDIVTVKEDDIIRAMKMIWERMKIVVEASSAVPLAALLAKRNLIPGKKIGVIISGGNVDLTKLPWM